MGYEYLFKKRMMILPPGAIAGGGVPLLAGLVDGAGLYGQLPGLSPGTQPPLDLSLELGAIFIFFCIFLFLFYFYRQYLAKCWISDHPFCLHRST